MLRVGRSRFSVLASEISLHNLLAAATYIARLFERNKIAYAVMGGFNMLLRGSDRGTRNIDFAVDPSTINTVQELLMTKPLAR